MIGGLREKAAKKSVRRENAPNNDSRYFFCRVAGPAIEGLEKSRSAQRRLRRRLRKVDRLLEIVILVERAGRDDVMARAEGSIRTTTIRK
jgi:hypothetical protein